MCFMQVMSRHLRKIKLGKLTILIKEEVCYNIPTGRNSMGVFTKQTFVEKLQEQGYEISDYQLKQYDDYQKLLVEWNEKMNLTARIGSVIKDKEYSLLDVGIAVEHFCLQAAELGLGTCIMGWFDEKKVKKLLGIGSKRVPLLVSLGYPAGETRRKARKALDEMSCWNKY